MSIYRRSGSDNWWISVSIAGRKTRRTTGTADRAKAEEFEQRERERLWRLHRLGDRGAIRFIDVAERWLNETQKRTRDKDEMILAWLCGEIGEEAVSSIDRDAIEELRKTALAEGMAPATVDRYMALLRAILRKCEYEWRLLEHAPKVPMYRPKPPEPRWLKPAEFERLLKELPLHLKLAARFAVLTGLRMREMLSLTWDRIDWQSAALGSRHTHESGPLPRDSAKHRRLEDVARTEDAQPGRGARLPVARQAQGTTAAAMDMPSRTLRRAPECRICAGTTSDIHSRPGRYSAA